MSDKKIILPETYFDNRSGQYWLKNPTTGAFLNLGARDCKLHMMRAGFFIDTQDSVGLKSGDSELMKIQLYKSVDYAGPLAGHKTGLFIAAGGQRILVTSQTTPVQPGKGKCQKLEIFFEQLLGAEQTHHVLLWLKVAWEGLMRGDMQPGQMLVLAGPAGCGKSFLQALITVLFGGRSAKPYRYMTGRTNFNSDLAGAEHLVIEDENAQANISARREFGTAIKDWTVNTEISIHAKGREAITLPFFRRLTLSVNDEPENLMILPPLDGSLMGKISLCKCEEATLSEDREENWRDLTGELPALVTVLKRMRIPPSMRDSRFRVKAYHNPELLAALSQISPEYRLETLINQIVDFDDMGRWTGNADELEQVLRGSSFAWAVDKLLSFSSAMGTYLSRLARKNPDRYEQKKNKGRTVWTIKKGE